MINAETVKAKLKNQATKRGHMLQEGLTAYGLERTIYRISISEYVDKFTLKGGIFLYALFDGNFTRATTDIDLLAQKTSNEVENIKKIFNEIFLIEVDDALRYDLDSFDVHSITEFKAYHGVNVSIVAYLDRTKIPISIDIGFGDIVAFEKGFTEDSIRKSRWKSFIKKKTAMESVDFGTAVYFIKDFLQPIVEKIIDKVEINIQWKSQKKEWK